MGRVRKFLSKDRMIRAAAVISTDVVCEMISRQKAQPFASLAAGRVATGALLLAAHLKKNQKVGIDIAGDGILGRVFAEADFEGRVRALVERPEAGDRHIGSLGEAIGSGYLTVFRSQPGSIEPQKGTIELVSGEIGDDIAHYLQQSQQVKSVVALATVLDSKGNLNRCGGIILEMLPGATATACEMLETAAANVSSFADVVGSGADAEDLCRLYLGDAGFLELPHEHLVRFQCQCSSERMARSVALLGSVEVGRIEKSGEVVRGRCEFCGKVFEISPEEIVRVLATMSTKS